MFLILSAASIPFISPFSIISISTTSGFSELANSIKELGIIQPITVRKTGFKSFQIISGERRLRAVKSLDIQSIPAFIRIANDQQSLEMALVENIQRQNLDPIEIALCYQRLIDDVKLTQEQMSSRVGKKRSTISNYLRLLKLDPIIQTGIRDGFISMGHGRTLVTIENINDQLKIYKKILSESLSVREVEKLSRNLKDCSKEIKKIDKSLPDLFKSNVNRLKKIFNAEVKIKLNGKEKGSIIIPFNNIAEYNKLNKILNSD